MVDWTVRNLTRFFVVALLTGIAVIPMLPDLARPWSPLPIENFADDNNSVVTWVEPKSPEAHAGLRIGDRLDTRDRTTQTEAWGVRPAGATLRVIRNGKSTTVRYTPEREQMTLLEATMRFLRTMVAVFGITVGVVLVLRRPSLVTWGFLLYILYFGNLAGTGAFLARLSYESLIAYTVLHCITSNLSLLGFLVFAFFFAVCEPPAWRLVTLRLAAVALVVVASIMLFYTVIWWSRGVPGGRVFSALSEGVPLLVYILGMVALLETYMHSPGESRERIKWVISGFGIGFAASVATWMLYDPSVNPVPPPSAVALGLGLLSGFVPLTVAYAVLKHRVIDVRFAISRAVVYAALTAVVVAIFSVIDWVMGTALEHSPWGLVVNISIAIGVGFWLNGLHTMIDRIVDRALFRRRYDAERYIERLARGLLRARSTAAINDALIAQAAQSLDLRSAALYRLNGRGFDLDGLRGWDKTELPSSFDGDDPLIMALQGDVAPMSLRTPMLGDSNLPIGERAPVLVAPVCSRQGLESFVLYGAHAGGSDIDPDEVKSLEQLANAAGILYDRLENEALRDQNAALQFELSHVKARA